MGENIMRGSDFRRDEELKVRQALADKQILKLQKELFEQTSEKARALVREAELERKLSAAVGNVSFTETRNAALLEEARIAAEVAYSKALLENIAELTTCADTRFDTIKLLEARIEKAIAFYADPSLLAEDAAWEMDKVLRGEE